MENTLLDDQFVHSGSEIEQATFYRKTYLHVALAVLAFIVVEAAFLQIPFLVEIMLSLTVGWRWLLLLGLFWLGTSQAERLAHHPDKSIQYAGLFGFVVLEALLFIPLIYIAMMAGGGGQMLMQAGVVTLGLFAGLSAVVFMTKTDFSFLRTGITIGFFIAIGLIVAGSLFGFNLGIWFSFAMVALAASSILYQTSKLKYEYRTDQYVGASLGLFASLMLLLWYVIQIFMSRD